MIEQGQVIILDNQKEYICVQNILQEDINYLYLVSNFKPLEVRFAKQNSNSNDLSIEIINNNQEKIELLKMFQEKNTINNSK